MYNNQGQEIDPEDLLPIQDSIGIQPGETKKKKKKDRKKSKKAKESEEGECEAEEDVSDLMLMVYVFAGFAVVLGLGFLFCFKPWKSDMSKLISDEIKDMNATTLKKSMQYIKEPFLQSLIENNKLDEFTKPGVNVDSVCKEKAEVKVNKIIEDQFPKNEEIKGDAEGMEKFKKAVKDRSGQFEGTVNSLKESCRDFIMLKIKKDPQKMQKSIEKNKPEHIEKNKPEHIENANDKNNAKVIIQDDHEDIARSDDEKIEEDKELMQNNVKKFIQYCIIPKLSNIREHVHVNYKYSQESMSTLIKTTYDDFVADKHQINQSLREELTKSTKLQEMYLELIQSKCTHKFGDFNELIRKYKKDVFLKTAAIATLIIIGVTCFAISCAIACGKNCCCCNKCSCFSQYISYIVGIFAAFGVAFLLMKKINYSGEIIGVSELFLKETLSN